MTCAACGRGLSRSGARLLPWSDDRWRAYNERRQQDPYASPAKWDVYVCRDQRRCGNPERRAELLKGA